MKSLAVALVAVLLPTAAFASCKLGICVSGRDRGDKHIITFHTTLSGITHFNFRSPNADFFGSQAEFAYNVTETRINIPAGRPVQISYSLQACRAGDLWGSSTCSPWARFTHTVRR